MFLTPALQTWTHSPHRPHPQPSFSNRAYAHVHRRSPSQLRKKHVGHEDEVEAEREQMQSLVRSTSISRPDTYSSKPGGFVLTDSTVINTK
jgi:hypothetical protein